MAPDQSTPAPSVLAGDSADAAPPLWLSLIRLARPSQWAKGAFVLLGPGYWIADNHFREFDLAHALAVLGALLSFGFASSACYVFNDIRDREMDRVHPRKQHRPIAAGIVSIAVARVFLLALLVLSAASLLLIPRPEVFFVGGAIAAYVLNVTCYSLLLKKIVILDVISLAVGFVLRVLAGCAAIAITPSTWLLNSTFFLAMFLAFGKRLGERRTMGPQAAAARAVQTGYTDDLLRMAVVVTAVATLVTYFGYVQTREPDDLSNFNFNLLWLTVLPATFGLLRAIVLLERGAYDDPTELAGHDRPLQAAVALFGLLTAVAVAYQPGG